MFVRYGSFDFTSGEAGLAVRVVANRSQRGFMTTRNVLFHINGEVCADGASAVTTRLNQIATAFDTNGGDIGLWVDTNTPTQHYLQSLNPRNLTGNQVLSSYFPETVGGEYVNGRKFSIEVGAVLDAAESNVLDWQDSITFTGNTGATYRWRRHPRLNWWAERTAPNSLQQITHSGFAVGLSTWIFPPTPFYSAPFEAQDSRVVHFGNPKRFPQGYVGYTTRWQYTYILPLADDLLRPTLP